MSQRESDAAAALAAEQDAHGSAVKARLSAKLELVGAKQKLAEDISDAATARVDELERALRLADLKCEAHSTRVEHAEQALKIAQFESDQAAFDALVQLSSAWLGEVMPRVERLVELAGACRDEITGIVSAIEAQNEACSAAEMLATKNNFPPDATPRPVSLELIAAMLGIRLDSEAINCEGVACSTAPELPTHARQDFAAAASELERRGFRVTYTHQTQLLRSFASWLTPREPPKFGSPETANYRAAQKILHSLDDARAKAEQNADIPIEFVES